MTPTTFRYNSFDRTGAAAAPGSYAFLMPDGQATSVVTTYEQLRTESTVMRVNAKDEHGASWGDFYDTVAAGDRFELRETSDCWTRYHVTEVTPPAGTYREFAIRPYAYAYEGCSGAIAPSAAVDYGWNPAPPSKPDFTTLIRFGPWILDPGHWPGGRSPNPVPEPSAPGGRSSGGWHNYSGDDPVGDLATVKRHPLWSEPDLPEDWRLYRAFTGNEGQYSFCASYTPPEGGYGVTVCIGYLDELPVHSGVSTTLDQDTVGKTIYELRIVDGHPAGLVYSPPGTSYPASPYAEIYDEETGILYFAIAYKGNAQEAGRGRRARDCAQSPARVAGVGRGVPMSGPRVTRRRARGNRGPCGGVLTSKARLGGVRDDCAPRAAFSDVPARRRSRARAGGVHRRPGRAPRAARDGDRAARRDARATGGDSTADRNCPARSDSDSTADPDSNPGALAGLDSHAVSDCHRDADDLPLQQLRQDRRGGGARQLRLPHARRPVDERRHDLRAVAHRVDGDARQREGRARRVVGGLL